MRLDEAIAALTAITNANQRPIGYQAAVARSGDLIHETAAGYDAHGAEIASDSLVPMYCTAKTLLLAPLVELVDDGELSLNDRVGDLVELDSKRTGDVSIEDLFTHRSGSLRPSMVEAVVLDATERKQLARRSSSFAPLEARRSRYTEASAWLLAWDALNEADSGNLADRVRRHTPAQPLIDLEGQDHLRRRTAWSGQRPATPLMLETHGCIDYWTQPGFGGYATATGLAQQMSLLIRWCRGGEFTQRGEQAAATILTAGPTRVDETFRRRCSFTAGLLGRLAGHGFGNDLPPDAVAQAGLGGMLTVVGDPRSETAVALYVSSAVWSSSLMDERRSLWSAIARDLRAAHLW